jgi:predicted  nucleic acid-binding Zn-ribbon protein
MMNTLSIPPLLLMLCLGFSASALADPTTPDAAELERLRAQKSTIESEIKSAQSEADSLKEELKKRSQDIDTANQRLQETQALIDAKTKDLGQAQ